MNVLFITNIPSPYRVDFFNELGKHCDLTVCFERKTSAERNIKWKGKNASTFKEVFPKLTPVGIDKSKGNGIVTFIKNNRFDAIIISGYSSPAVMSAIFYCKQHHIDYFLEYDGAFYKKDKFYLRWLKKILLKKAKVHFTTCDEHKRYLCSLGIPENRIIIYPFSSVFKSDIEKNFNVSEEEKITAKKKIGAIQANKTILSIGQFIYRKGFDVLLKSFKDVPPDYELFIVGGLPTSEYLKIVESLNLKNVHFVDFKTKEELVDYFRAAELFVLPTREDIWGLVVNEAMSFGLPVITTNKCIAGLELINGKNGIIVETNCPNALSDAITKIFSKSGGIDKEEIFKIISNYTIERMAEKHLEVLNGFYGKE